MLNDLLSAETELLTWFARNEAQMLAGWPESRQQQWDDRVRELARVRWAIEQAKMAARKAAK